MTGGGRTCRRPSRRCAPCANCTRLQSRSMRKKRRLPGRHAEIRLAPRHPAGRIGERKDSVKVEKCNSERRQPAQRVHEYQSVAPGGLQQRRPLTACPEPTCQDTPAFAKQDPDIRLPRRPKCDGRLPCSLVDTSQICQNSLVSRAAAAHPSRICHVKSGLARPMCGCSPPHMGRRTSIERPLQSCGGLHNQAFDRGASSGQGRNRLAVAIT